MARAEPEKRVEARRLVEGEGLSLAAAADRVGVNRTTVRAWQKADEVAGDGWTFTDPHSAAQKTRADAMTAKERAAQVERARQATDRRWKNRRESEADAAGIAATAIRVGIQDAATRYRAAVATGEVDDAAKIALGAQRWGVLYGVLFDKADQGSGLAVKPQTVVVEGSDETYQGELAAVLSWADELARARGRRAG